ncbi:MAG TPA: amidohydrolase family protein [Burkholderiales bacterium]|nr:amidohydrolase family protein [Burkholderiales bacterium]
MTQTTTNEALRVPQLRLPAGACDCHVHILGPESRYPYKAERRYTPPDATIEDYVALARRLGIERAVLVQPSVYGSDNRAILDALREQKMPLRGIAVVDDDIGDKALEEMAAVGVRGLRLRPGKGSIADEITRAAQRIAPLGWHAQLRVGAKDYVALETTLERFPVDFVIDHIGQVPVAEGLDGAAFAAIRRIAAYPRCWVKLSAPMRMSAQGFPYADVDRFVQALLEVASNRLLWATDWPHTNLKAAAPDDADLVDLVARWLPDARLREKILVHNPARLYGF